jgi:uncharacterized protein (DUF1501 family)
MQRRSFLKLSVMAMLGAALGNAHAQTPNKTLPTGAPLLVVVELRGGNDGLNTVIPFRDPLYKALRPTLAVPQAEVISLSDDLGFNPALKPLMSAWDAGDMAVALGLGYENPDRSHFRAAEIWETAAPSNAPQSAPDADMGWGSRLLPLRADRPVLDAVILGPDAGLTYQSPDVVSLTLSRPAQLARLLSSSASPEEHAPKPTGHAALDHILDIQHDRERALSVVYEAAARAPAVPKKPAEAFPVGPVGATFGAAAKLIGARLSTSVLHITLKGFDTHARQRATHDRLLGELAQGLSALRAHLIASGQWSNTVVMTYSEFGRRPAENGSQGTDHGAAAPHFIMGGFVRGGLYGKQPGLDVLDGRGDLGATTHFRLPLHEVAVRCWGLPIDKTLSPLGFLKPA